MSDKVCFVDEHADPKSPEALAFSVVGDRDEFLSIHCESLTGLASLSPDGYSLSKEETIALYLFLGNKLLGVGVQDEDSN